MTKRILALTMMVCLLCLVGCGREDNSSAGQGTVTSATTVAAEADRLYINECIPLLFENLDKECREKSCLYDTYGNRLYVLWICVGEEDATGQLSLYVFDGETKKTEQQSFTLQIPDRENYHIKSMDVRDGGQLSFRIWDGEEDFLVITDMEGTVLSCQEPFPDQEDYPWNADELHRFENRAFDNGEGSIILSRCREQANVTELFLYDSETSGEKPLTVLDGELVRALCTDGADTLYYTTVGSLNRWNRADNTRTRLLNLHENGISASPTSNNLLINSKGELMICELEGNIPYVFVLSGEKNQTEDGIRISILADRGSDALDRPVQIFSRSHPEYGFTLEQYSDKTERQTLHDRVFVELATGRGPDMMWVSREDMHTLNEKGLLMDISELIPKDIWDSYCPV